MSLVAYGSSDESENDEEINEDSQKVETPAKVVETPAKLEQPPKEREIAKNLNGVSTDHSSSLFDVIPNPISTDERELDPNETDRTPLPKKLDYDGIEKPPKRKGPLKIFAPALTNLDDDDDDQHKVESTRPKITSSKESSGLVGILPKPNNIKLAATTRPMIPHVLTKKPAEATSTTQPLKRSVSKPMPVTSKPQTATLKSLSNYNSDSEDEDFKGTSSGLDFFSLSTSTKIPDEQLQPLSNTELYAIAGMSSASKSQVNENNETTQDSESKKILVNNVINLPKEEILLKNKAEVGPKLPVPEQEYHLDSEGNVAFDDKAIEYLCGKRGVKRKNELNNVDIIEINGEDIKPDEREWLVKALTEEAPTRPVSIGTGPGGQSKKKHQITYLAHQAKAMEIELKNQWAQNKASRQQTRSKYGF